MESTLIIATGVTAIPTVILAVATVFLALSTRRSAQASEKVIAANRDMVTENCRMVEVNHEMVEEMRAGCIAQEQPHVIVDLGFKGDLLDLVIRNVGRGIAKNIEFSFSPPLDDIRGISPTPDLSVFKSQLDFLAPGGEIPVFWGISSVVIRALEDRGLAEGITVKIRCSSWAGEEYVYERKISPVLLAVGRIERNDPDDLIVAVEQISRTLSEFLRMHRESP